jgi:hypothetical protein
MHLQNIKKAACYEADVNALILWLVITFKNPTGPAAPPISLLCNEPGHKKTANPIKRRGCALLTAKPTA